MPKPKNPCAIALLLLERARKLISDPERFMRRSWFARRAQDGRLHNPCANLPRFRLDNIFDFGENDKLNCFCPDGALIVAAYRCGVVPAAHPASENARRFFRDTDGAYSIAMRALAAAMREKIGDKQGVRRLLKSRMLSVSQEAVWNSVDGIDFDPIAYQDILTCFERAKLLVDKAVTPRDR